MITLTVLHDGDEDDLTLFEALFLKKVMHGKIV